MFSITAKFIIIVSLFIVNSLLSQTASPIQVTTTGGIYPTVSPDGQWVAFDSESPSGVAKIKTNGTQLTQLTDFGGDTDWSRSNNLIVARDEDNLFTIDPLTGDTTNIRNGGFDDGPAWKPDGTEIALEGSIKIVSYPGGTISNVPCIDPDGTSCDGERPTWSPDGNWIAFEDGLEILKVSRSGGTAEVVVANLRDVSTPSWSPDGNWIAFAMNDSIFYYDFHIWVTDARGVNFGLWQVTSGTTQDWDPAWSPNSDTIFFDSNRSGQYEIWKIAFEPPTGIGQDVENKIAGFELYQNYPNPFNPFTTVTYKLSKAEHVRLTVYNMLGQEVVTLLSERQTAGVYRVQWNGRNQEGMPAASGVYLYTLRAGEFAETRKMLLLR